MLFVSSACVRKRSIAEVICQLAEHNIKNIELSGGTDYYSKLENDLVDLKHYYKLNYVCHAYFPPPKIPFVVNLASCNDYIYKQSVDHYMQCIEMLKRIECKILSIHAGFLIEIETDEIGRLLSSRILYEENKAYDRFCAAFEKISKSCIANGIDLYLENNVLNMPNYKEFGYHNYMMMTDYLSIMKMKRQIEFNLLLDLGHLHVSSKTLGFNYAEECNKLRNYVEWIHISENNGVIDEHKPLKQESEIIKAFRKMYNPHINATLETVGNIEDILSSIKIAEDNVIIAEEG